jgi:hypothetical protein
MANADKSFFNQIITGDETWCFAYDPKTKWQSSDWVGEISPRPKKLKFQKVLHQDHVDIFFRLSRRSAQRICTRGKKTVNAEFYKRVIDRLLKHIQKGSTSRVVLDNFSCCTIIRLPTKLHKFDNF